MSATSKDESNIRVLPTANSKTNGCSSAKEPSQRPLSARAGSKLPCESGENFTITGNFADMGTEKIAKRLCEHMNLTYNLCCQLEHIADGLPENVDMQECLYVARSIIPVVKRAHEFEESVLFPLLREKSPDTESLDKTLERLQGEHWEDESYASEIHNSLISYVSGIAEANVESLGYMLRGFFEGMRRHLAFEREHVLPLLQQLDAAR